MLARHELGSRHTQPANFVFCTRTGRTFGQRNVSVDEIAFLLGHRNANVTRAVYVHELADTRRRAMRRSRMVAEYGDLLKP